MPGLTCFNNNNTTTTTTSPSSVTETSILANCKVATIQKKSTVSRQMSPDIHVLGTVATNDFLSGHHETKVDLKNDPSMSIFNDAVVITKIPPGQPLSCQQNDNGTVRSHIEFWSNMRKLTQETEEKEDTQESSDSIETSNESNIDLSDSQSLSSTSNDSSQNNVRSFVTFFMSEDEAIISESDRSINGRRKSRFSKVNFEFRKQHVAPAEKDIQRQSIATTMERNTSQVSIPSIESVNSEKKSKLHKLRRSLSMQTSSLKKRRSSRLQLSRRNTTNKNLESCSAVATAITSDSHPLAPSTGIRRRKTLKDTLCNLASRRDSSVSTCCSLVSLNSEKSTASENMSVFNVHMNDRVDIRRSWSNVDIRYLKALFRKSNLDGIDRRNSYTPPSSKEAKKRLAVESDYRLAKHVIQSQKEQDFFSMILEEKKESNEDSRSSQIRRFVAQEIFITEKNFSDHMKIVKDMFMGPFMQAANTHRPLVNPSDLPVIFAYVPELLKLSINFSKALDSVTQNWNDTESRIGQTFLNFTKDFEVVYSQYAENFRNSQAAIKRANKNVLYRKFIQESLRKKETNRLGLSDYMVIPIQRVTRYCMLLKDLKKHTKESNCDYMDLCSAIDTMERLAKKCNDSQSQ